MTIRIADLKPDKANRRKHGERNVDMIAQSLREIGAARSIVVDEDGNILAGNATVEAAAKAGIERVQVVDADGQTIIAVRRSNLDAETSANWRCMTTARRSWPSGTRRRSRRTWRRGCRLMGCSQRTN